MAGLINRFEATSRFVSPVNRVPSLSGWDREGQRRQALENGPLAHLALQDNVGSTDLVKRGDGGEIDPRSYFCLPLQLDVEAEPFKHAHRTALAAFEIPRRQTFPCGKLVGGPKERFRRIAALFPH